MPPEFTLGAASYKLLRAQEGAWTTQPRLSGRALSTFSVTWFEMN